LSWTAAAAAPEYTPGAFLKSQVTSSFTELLMYPNPANTQLTLGVDAAQEGKLQVNIYSMQGTMVKSSSRQCNVGVNLWQEDITDLSGGIYQVVMQYGAKSEVMRLVVE
jgi:hypothetical protein